MTGVARRSIRTAGSTDPAGMPASNGAPAFFSIRPLATVAEYRASVLLQQATWGAGYVEIVPASVLRLTQRLGGIASGAFSDQGELIGFVYGITGLVEGRLVHWSHMLAVSDGSRNAGVGRRLKAHQRALLHGTPVEEMRWTFDPLVARNGHLNLNVLGATVVEYVLDAYADSGSDLHAFGTDRFVVRWPVEPCDAAAAGSAAGDAAPADIPLLNVPPGGATERGGVDWCAEWLRVEVPADVESMRHGELQLARSWRASTRAALVEALAHGYRVVGFRGNPGQPGSYLLRRGSGG
jgi:chorismate synthase